MKKLPTNTNLISSIELGARRKRDAAYVAVCEERFRRSNNTIWMKANWHKNSGFTLIEVMVALVIVVISFVAITNSILYSQMSSLKSRKSIVASYLASEKMSEVNMTYSTIPIKEIPEKESGTFPKPNDGFSWEIKSQPFEYDLGAIAASLLGEEESQGDQLGLILRNLSQTLKESIKEVTVTIFWKSGKIERKFSLTTHFIDKEMQLPSLGSFLGLPGGGGGGGE